MAGGGSSGKVSYPTQMQTQQTSWMTDIDGIIQTALLAPSPYNGEVSYNPSSDIATMETRVAAFETIVAAIDEESEWESYVNKALTKADEVLFDSTVLTNARTAFNNRTETEFINGVNGLSAWAGGVGAVDSSAFSIGLALLEMERKRKVDDFDSSLQFELYKLRGQYLIQGTQQMSQILSTRISGQQAVSALRSEVLKTTIVAKKEETDKNLEIDVLDSLYDIKLFEYGGHMLGAISGGIAGVNEPSPIASAIGGAVSGFAAGGPAGALVGGVGGLLSSIF